MNTANESGKPLEMAGEAATSEPAPAREQEKPRQDTASAVSGSAGAGESGPGRHAGPEEPYKGTGGGVSGWFQRHKVLAGIILGLLAAALLGGMFAIGFAVGRPGEEKGRREFPELLQRWEERQLTPRMERRLQRLERLDILAECREEIEEFLAAQLGLPVEEMRKELRKGKTVAELAEERGLSAEDLIGSLAAKIREIADRLSAEGEITSERAEAVKSRAESLASLMVHGGFRFLTAPFGR